MDGIFNSEESAITHGGIGAGELPPTDLQVKLMTESHTRPEYLKFLEHNDLRSFVREIMGWDKEVLLQRTMLRHNAPGALSTAVHVSFSLCSRTWPLKMASLEPSPEALAQVSDLLRHCFQFSRKNPSTLRTSIPSRGIIDLNAFLLMSANVQLNQAKFADSYSTTSCS